MKIIRTVLGDVESIGSVNAHEHLLMQDPLLKGEELLSVSESTQELARAAQYGLQGVVELTPLGLGRDPEGLAEISRQSGVHIVMATGVHQEAHYANQHWIRGLTERELEALFVREIQKGSSPPENNAQTTSVRAGVIKVGAGYWRISAFEEKHIRIAARAQQKTGVAVFCHTEFGTAAHEILDLFESEGMNLQRVVLAHLDRNPDPVYHLELISRGAILQYDGFARTKYHPMNQIIDCLEKVYAGYPNNLLLGGDVARRRSFEVNGGLAGIPFLHHVVVPRLIQTLGKSEVQQIFVENPARVLSFDPNQP